ncbi:hypothetical protein EV426DRAFT_576352 [Tirmania nivea]|nr:hypothetical protein EV426DRAFT_576352 [Tirmania nivea]
MKLILPSPLTLPLSFSLLLFPLLTLSAPVPIPAPDSTPYKFSFNLVGLKPVTLSISPSAMLSHAEPFLYKTTNTLAAYQEPQDLSREPNRLLQHRKNTQAHVDQNGVPWARPPEPGSVDMEKVLDERHYRRYEQMVRDGTVVVEVGPEGERRLVWANSWEVEEEGRKWGRDDDGGGDGETSEGGDGGGRGGGGGSGSGGGGGGGGGEGGGGGGGGGGDGGAPDGGHHEDELSANKLAPHPSRRRKPVDPTYGTDMLSLLGKNNGMEKDSSSGKTTFEKYLDEEIDVSQQSIYGKDIPREYSDDEAVRARYGLSAAPVKRKKVSGEVVEGLEKGKMNCDVVPETPEWRDEEYVRLAGCLGLRDQVRGPYRTKMPGFKVLGMFVAGAATKGGHACL